MSYIPGGGGSDGSAWTTAYSVDFSTLSTGVHPGGDGTVTIDGKTWYAKNVANSEEMRVVNGEGLVIDPNANSSDIFNGTYTCPVFACRFSELGILNVSEARIWTTFAFTGIDADFEQVGVMIEQLQSTIWHAALVRVYDSLRGGQGWDVRRAINFTTARPSGKTDNLTDDVLLLQWRGLGRVAAFTGPSSGGNFPAMSAMRQRHEVSENWGAGTGPDILSALDLAFAFYVCPVNTSNTLRGSLKKFLVEYRP